MKSTNGPAIPDENALPSLSLACSWPLTQQARGSVSVKRTGSALGEGLIEQERLCLGGPGVGKSAVAAKAIILIFWQWLSALQTGRAASAGDPRPELHQLARLEL